MPTAWLDAVRLGKEGEEGGSLLPSLFLFLSCLSFSFLFSLPQTASLARRDAGAREIEATDQPKWRVDGGGERGEFGSLGAVLITKNTTRARRNRRESKAPMAVARHESNSHNVFPWSALRFVHHASWRGLEPFVGGRYGWPFVLLLLFLGGGGWNSHLPSCSR